MCCFNLQVKSKEENANQVIWHYRHLVSIGALLTILSLGFDIFTQQVLSTRYLNVAETNTSLGIAGTVPRADSYQQYTHGFTLTSKYIYFLECSTLSSKRLIADAPSSCTSSPVNDSFHFQRHPYPRQRHPYPRHRQPSCLLLHWQLHMAYNSHISCLRRMHNRDLHYFLQLH